ncbi:succinylglutamate desuccinylase/aspartoacylase family protein [Candidatus Peregrinibacteria bacterium]|nr:MAG: succinylglutamate desuccinylase/aspartoacylase family protein [Candidatus Peregrinibacteria bacterium]
MKSLESVKSPGCELIRVVEGIWYALPQGHQKGNPCTVISGYIHGNEQVGKAMLALKQQIEDGQFYPQEPLLLIHGNPQATAQNSRYCENDLNRCFGLVANPNTLEAKRAHQIKQVLIEYAPKIKQHIDLHNSILPAPQMLITPWKELPTEGEMLQQTLLFMNRLKIKTLVYGSGFYGQNGQYTDFDCYTHHQHGANSATLEWGQLGTNHTEKVIEGLKQTLLNSPKLLEASANEIEVWDAYQAIFKQEDSFQYAHSGYGNFEPLTEGEIIATQANDIWTANSGDHLLFPNPNVAVGQRAGIFMRRVGLQDIMQAAKVA